MDYKLVGNHPEILEGGRPVAPGEEITLNDEEAALPVNALLIEHGIMVPIEQLQEEVPVDATPEAVKFAEDNELDLRAITGTGQDGRILKSDVEEHLKNKEEVS